MAGMDPFTAGFNALAAVIDKIFPDPEQAAKAKVMILSQEMAPLMANLEVNKAEAASESMLVAGWRPAIGWVCGGALAMQYLVGPMIQYAGLFAFTYGVTDKIPPAIAPFEGGLYELMFGMLGIAGLRSFEKVKGVASAAIGAVKK